METWRGEKATEEKHYGVGKKVDGELSKQRVG